MKSIFVDLHLFADIAPFVAITANIQGDIFAVSERYKVNAKSVMGMFSLDLANPIEIIFDESVTDEEIKMFDKFLA